MEKLQEEVTKVNILDQAVTIRLVLKVVKCLLVRRLPKRGFTSRLVKPHVLTTGFLNKFNNTEINLEFLRTNNIINKKVKSVKIILNGKLDKPISISNKILLTKGRKKDDRRFRGNFFE